MRKLFCFFFLTVILICAAKTDKTEPDILIEKILASEPENFKKITDYPDKYNIQIIYTQINRDRNNVPSFTQYNYMVNSKKYFYAASLVKLPCSSLALEKIHELNIKGVDKDSYMTTDSACTCQKKTIDDTTSKSKFPSVAQYIRRMLLISDNDAYSRIYEFLGQKYIHEKMTEKGYPDAFIIHRFDANCSTKNNMCTNPVSFFDNDKRLIYVQKEQINNTEYKNPIGEIKIGKAYMNTKNKLVKEPKDFSSSNYLSLQDINDMLKSIVFPNSVEEKKRFNISEEDRKFMLRYLSMLPRESNYPTYNVKDFYDSYKKYLIYGNNKKKIEQDTLRIFNIVGQSYGYMTDVAYICDFKNKIEFILSAVIYVNEDGILNDGKYEYNSVALPYFSNLGMAIYNYERKRKQEFSPDLSEFHFNYSN